MNLTLNEIIEQLEDARAIQATNELESYRKWIPILRDKYTELKIVPIDRETFGTDDQWQLDGKFRKELKMNLETYNENHWDIYEEQLEEVVLALHRMGYLNIESVLK